MEPEEELLRETSPSPGAEVVENRETSKAALLVAGVVASATVAFAVWKSSSVKEEETGEEEERSGGEEKRKEDREGEAEKGPLFSYD